MVRKTFAKVAFRAEYKVTVVETLAQLSQASLDQWQQLRCFGQNWYTQFDNSVFPVLLGRAIRVRTPAENKRDKYPKPELDDDEQVDSDAEEESESESD
eukprot:COSAG02_NODE_33672_length_496_cov_1.289673_1_plen_99_part_00